MISSLFYVCSFSVQRPCFICEGRVVQYESRDLDLSFSIVLPPHQIQLIHQATHFLKTPPKGLAKQVPLYLASILIAPNLP